jgi:threonine/homoserine/homoserine lactone efflux protein
MISASTPVTFFAAGVCSALCPGQTNIFVLTQSALRGRAAGIVVTLGLCAGLVVHTLAAAFQASAIAFTGLKMGGAAYLAWQAFRSR